MGQDPRRGKQILSGLEKWGAEFSRKQTSVLMGDDAAGKARKRA